MEKSITYKYELKNIGIGDLTFFCGEMLLRLNKEDILEIQISQNILNQYRGGSESYKKFCIEYIKFILSDFVVLECETNIEKTWELNRDYINKMLIDDRIKGIFKDKFSNGSINDEYIRNINKDKIIDLTKDDYSSEEINLENIVNDLTLILNSKKIIMMGGGGFFCMSLLTDKLLSLVNEEIFSQFQTEHNKQIFINFDDYIREIQNV